MAETTSPSLSPTGSAGPLGGGSGGEEIRERGVAGGDTPPTTQRRRSTGLAPQRGRRPMREYPVTRNELLTLGGVGLLASACFGLGANFTFSSLQLQENLELSQNQGISPQIIAKWEAREYDYWYFGIALLIIGALAVAFFSATIWDIIKSTEYQD